MTVTYLKQKTIIRTKSTRKLCCRKDDQAMRPIHGAPKFFGTPWLRPTSTATIPNIYSQTIDCIIKLIKFIAVFVPHLPTAPGTCKKMRKKANLSRLASHAALSQMSPAIASRQTSKPADEGPHRSAWGSSAPPDP